MSHQQPCWSCANACGGCSWSRYDEQTPVDGWKAKKLVKGYSDRSMYSYDTYVIIDCPEYVKDSENDGLSRLGKDLFRKRNIPVLMIDKNLNVVKRFDNISQASQITGYDISTVKNHCEGYIRKFFSKVKYTFIYEENKEECLKRIEEIMRESHIDKIPI